DDGVHRLDVGVDDPLFADDELAAHADLAADRALDLDRFGPLELALELRGLASHREERDRRGRVPVGDDLGQRGLLWFLASEHRSLLLNRAAHAHFRAATTTGEPQ